MSQLVLGNRWIPNLIQKEDGIRMPEKVRIGTLIATAIRHINLPFLNREKHA